MGSQTAPTRVWEVSPVTAFKNWTKDLEVIKSPTERLHLLLASNVLPHDVRVLLRRCLCPVPRSGLFTAAHWQLGIMTDQEAFARDDLVQQLLKLYKEEGSFKVLLMSGMRGRGRNFSVPWAVVETIRRIQEMAAGATGNSNSSSSTNDNSSGSTPRVPFIITIPCYATDQPKTDDLNVLLSVAAFLGAPIVFDQFSKWDYLPGVLKHWLQGQRPRDEAAIQLLSPQFIMTESSHTTLYEASRRSLVGYGSLGVADMQRLPLPSLQLVAGMLQRYHGSYTPDKLLQLVCRTGLRLDLLSWPHSDVPLEDFALKKMMNELRLLADNQKQVAALCYIVQHGSIKPSSKWYWHLRFDCDVVESSCFEPDVLVLANPQLIMVNQLQSGFSPFARTEKSREQLEHLALTAEGKALKLLVRKALLPVIAERLDLTGLHYQKVWGSVGQGKLDFGLMFEEGPMVWGSCKRQQSKQTAACFVPHIKALAKSAFHRYEAHNKELRRLKEEYWEDEDKEAALQAKYDYHPVVQTVRHICLGGKGLVLVGVSAVPAEGSREVRIQDIDVMFEGRQYTVQCTYQHFVFSDLVQPLVAEPCRHMSALNSFDSIGDFLAAVA